MINIQEIWGYPLELSLLIVIGVAFVVGLNSAIQARKNDL